MQQNMMNSKIKRLFDITISFLGLLALMPLFGVIAWWIKRDSPGPVFYRGRRVGRGGREFLILKFRTMYERSESYAGPKVTAEDDPRITPVGKWLRDTKLNELPQLWNVLKGDMSLVGPRPEDPDIVMTWPEGIRKEILSVRPGITSPASVLYRDEEKLLQSNQVMEKYLETILPDKLRLDQLYIRHRSFFLDLDILLWTFLVLVPRVGEYRPPEQFLFLGPISRFVTRYLNWFLIDAFIALVSVSVSGVIWRSFAPLRVGWTRSIIAALIFSALFSVSGSLFGVQRVVWKRARGEDALVLLPPSLLATGMALVLNKILLLDRAFPSEMVLFAATLSFIDFILVRYRSRLLRSVSVRFLQKSSLARAARERIIILGGGKAGEMAALVLQHPLRDTLPFEIVGFVDDDLYKQGERIAGFPVLGQSQDLPHLVAQHDIGVVVFAIHNISGAERAKILDICLQANVKIVFFPDFWRVLSATIGLNGNHKNAQVVSASIVYGYPGIAAGQVDAWLIDIEKHLREGAADEALQHVIALRRQLSQMEAETQDKEFNRLLRVTDDMEE
ncbi:MAG: hypothetical protein D6732_24225 [Methanobacteriota archaeon]|nr:MAG: hypothetical protein D6732_24225 [Euryarchaeota archaeon]